MQAHEIPTELIALLDERAGRTHRPAGTVLTTLAEILTVYDRLRPIEPDVNTSYIRPTIGRIVLYRGKQGLHAMRPAIISCTVDTLKPEGVAAGEIPALDDPDHVHLHVFTPSALGFFIEYNVPRAAGSEIQPGEWAWPPRV